jgi:osmotically-inducible protein OsmY
MITQDLSDARQESQIWTAYALNPYLRSSDLRVVVRNGNAKLTGNVPDAITRDLARQIALGVADIDEVDNQIEIRAGYSAPLSAERGFGEMVDDATITSTVRLKMLWSRHAEELGAQVDTTCGRVSLSGVAESVEARDMAGKLAANTHGVRSVDNQLLVESVKAGMARSEASNAINLADAWITLKVKSTFLYSTNVDSSRIEVSTQGGVVELSGKLDSVAERAVAIELAANVRGVRSVDSAALTT